MKYYLGMDIGGTKCAVVISDEKAEKILGRIRFETKPSRGYNAVIDELISSALRLMESLGIDSRDIKACGISCGGPLDSENGIIMGPPNLPGWNNVPLADMVMSRLDVPVKIRNDADACALAEWQFGAGKGTENMIFLTFGTGMGAGLILNGSLYSGATGTAGEVGHIRLQNDGPVGYGKAGSFEGFCSGGGISALSRIMLSDYKGKTLLDYDALTAKNVAEKAAAGDELALEIYGKCGEMLGRGIAVLIDILNPEKIVIGSIYQRSGELMVAEMKKALEAETLMVNLEACEIVPSALKDEIGDFAAIGVAKEYGDKLNGK